MAASSCDDTRKRIEGSSMTKAQNMATLATEPRNERWLSCHLDKGMFSDEVAVTYPASGDWRKSVFVPRAAVCGSVGSVGKVRVLIVDFGGKTLAVLPSSQQDVVEVEPADIL
jgi:hypothetical protein